MKNYIAEFDPKVAQEINQQVELAAKIWKKAKPDLSGIRITVGNYAAYGRYCAQCHSTGVIEIPVGNSFSLLEFNGENRLVHAYQDKTELLGTVLHEIAHHVVNTSKTKPWADGPQIGASTHLNRSWLWLCSVAWNHFHSIGITPNTICYSHAQDAEPWVDALRRFNPYKLPPRLAKPEPKLCQYCNSQFVSSRSDAKYCSVKCRVASHRDGRGAENLAPIGTETAS